MKNTETKQSNQEIVFISATDEVEIEKQLEKAKELLKNNKVQSRVIINGDYAGNLKEVSDHFINIGCSYVRYSSSVLSENTDQYFEKHSNIQNIIVLR